MHDHSNKKYKRLIVNTFLKIIYINTDIHVLSNQCHCILNRVRYTEVSALLTSSYQLHWTYLEGATFTGPRSTMLYIT